MLGVVMPSVTMLTVIVMLNVIRYAEHLHASVAFLVLHRL
jgi:hypothetical protein